MRPALPLFLTLFFGQTPSLLATTAADADLFALSLDELGEVMVTVASHRPERMVETPAIVSRYSADELAEMGLRTLRDMLSFIPGITMQDHLFGQPIVSIRGVYEGFNQKVLFLLDDTPYFMPSHSDIPLLGIPIEAIDHIEVIRGPGAMYYGTNATAGVIKIITKKTGDNYLSARLGENAYLNSGGVYHSGQQSWGELSASFEVQRDQGYQATYPAYDMGGTSFAEGDIDKREETSSVLLNYRKKDFKLQAQAYETLYTGIAEPRQLENLNKLTYKGFLLGLRNDWKTKSSILSVFADYNRSWLDFLVDDFPPASGQGGFRFANDGANNYRGRFGINYSRRLNNTFEVFVGVEHEVRSTEEYLMIDAATGATLGSIMPAFSLDEKSLYAQLDITPTANWRFLLGGRYTDNSITGNDTVPRLAAIYQLDSRQSVKLLYSVGFNSPSFTQLKADIPPFIMGNPSLTPEKVATTDLSYTLTGNNALFVANVWHLRGRDFIENEVVGGTKTFINSNRFTRSGIELDFQYQPRKNWRLLTSAAYYNQGNIIKADDSGLAFVPRYTLNLGSQYRFTRSDSLGVSLRNIGKRSSAAALWLLNLDYQKRLESWQFFATVENLLDETILHPNIGEFNDRLVPGGQERNLKLGLRYYL